LGSAPCPRGGATSEACEHDGLHPGIARSESGAAGSGKIWRRRHGKRVGKRIKNIHRGDAEARRKSKTNFLFEGFNDRVGYLLQFGEYLLRPIRINPFAIHAADNHHANIACDCVSH
jgi:hypothetical protein